MRKIAPLNNIYYLLHYIKRLLSDVPTMILRKKNNLFCH